MNSASTSIGGAPNSSGVTLKEQDEDNVVAGAKVKFALVSANVDVVFRNKNDGSLTTVAEQDNELTIAMVGMLSPPTPSMKCVVASQVRVIVPENVDAADAVVGEIVFCGLVAASNNLSAVPKASVTLSTLGVLNKTPLPLTTRLLYGGRLYVCTLPTGPNELFVLE